MSENFMIATVKSILHISNNDRLQCDSLAREIVNFVRSNTDDFISVYGDISEANLESFTMDYIHAIA